MSSNLTPSAVEWAHANMDRGPCIAEYVRSNNVPVSGIKLLDTLRPTP